MTTIDFSFSVVGWVAMMTGIVGLLASIFLILFFAVGQPFGTLNDAFIGLAGASSVVLAWMLHSHYRAQSPLLSWAALLVVAIGAFVVAVGSVLVIFRITGYFLSGLYMATGNALIGLWLLGLNYAVWRSDPWPHGLVLLGVVTGVLMALGLVTIPGILKGIDGWESAPWYISYVGLVGGLGWLVLYPVWCILLGRVFTLT
jgi:hypothetical protein